LAGLRKRWIFVSVLLVAAAIGIAFLAGGREDERSSVEQLRGEDAFALFYAGDAVAGYPLDAVRRDEDGAGGAVTFFYGTCEQPHDGTESGCVPPVQVQVLPACPRLPYSDSAFSSAPRSTAVRGVRAASYEGGAFVIPTADSTVVILAKDPLAVARALRGINNDVEAGEPLPKPVPVDCSS
jgi:hypothetical protein